MHSLPIKTLTGGMALLVTMLACSLVSQVAPSLPAATESGSPVPAAAIPTIQSAHKVASPSIQTLEMVDTNNGWGTGEAGVVRTTDGGSSWFIAAPDGISGRPTAASFLDGSTAWVVYPSADFTSGTLYHTTDGGSTWNQVAVPFGGVSLHFVDASNGWVLFGLSAGMSHEAVAIFRSHDGGATWSQVFINDPNAAGSSDSLPLVGDKNGITALDASQAWVTGAQPSSDFIYIYHTSDGGKNWVQQDAAMPGGIRGAMTNTLLPVFFSASEAILPVQLFADSNWTDFYLSHDGGQTWNASAPLNQGGLIAAGSPKDFFVWDGGASLNASHDAGSTWEMVTPNVNLKDNLNFLQFIGASTGWALASDSSGHDTLYRTTDGGASWTILVP